jgi:hypothetical protein
MLQNIYQELGPLTLCGVLHFTYQTPENTVGDFMVCVLFSCYLVLVKGFEDFRRLEAVACISLGDLRMDTPQNGQGERGSAPLLASDLTSQGFIATDAHSHGSSSSKTRKIDTNSCSVHPLRRKRNIGKRRS